MISINIACKLYYNNSFDWLKNEKWFRRFLLDVLPGPYYKHCLKYGPGTFLTIHNIITKIEIVILLTFKISKS